MARIAHLLCNVMEHVLYLFFFVCLLLYRTIDVIIKMTLSLLLYHSPAALLLPFHGPTVALHATDTHTFCKGS